MSPVLDATEIKNESDLSSDRDGEKFPVRSITLEMSAECETAINLLIQKQQDGTYRTGCRIFRFYDTDPYEVDKELLPETNESNTIFTSLGDAVIDAAESAHWWISTNSDDNDEKVQLTKSFLQNWIYNFDPEIVTEAIFNDAVVATETPATEEPEPTSPPVIDEARQYFENEKHRLEEKIGELSIQQVKLKVAIKGNREAMTEYTQELQELLLRGPERLPLFDRAKPTSPEIQGEAATDAGANAAIPTEMQKDVNAAIESWKEVTVEDLKISSAICKILREENNIKTLGDIAKYCEEYALTDLKKIGKAKAEQIEAAMDDYWKANPRA